MSKSDNGKTLAEAQAEQMILEARAKLSPTAQVLQTILDSVTDWIGRIVVGILIAMIIIAIAYPNFYPAMTNFLFHLK